MSCKVSDFSLSRELADDDPQAEYETQVLIRIKNIFDMMVNYALRNNGTVCVLFA